jgi:hypothetical protein
MQGIASTQPLVSVVTVFCNRADYVKESVGSLLAQTYRNLEIIVVDDGSTDDTLERMHAFADDPRVVIVAKANTGFTNSIGQAIANAKGAIIAIHGSGDISHPERIEKQVQVLIADLKVGIVGCHVLNPVVGQSRFKRIGRPNGLDLRRELLRGNMFTHGEVMYRKAVYDAVGGYRPVFEFGQDVDLWLRMSRVTDYRIVEEVLYTRREIAGGVSSSPRKVLRQQRLTELARQSALEVDAGRPDLVDLHGDEAPNYMRRTSRLAERLSLAGARTMINEANHRDGWALVRAGFNEYPTKQSIAVYLALSTHRVPVIFRSLVEPAFKGLWRLKNRRAMAK